MYDGPYRVLEVSEDGLSVTLDIPNSRRHPVFHIEKLKKASMPLNHFPALTPSSKETANKPVLMFYLRIGI